jgi:hypothetical protein
MLAILAAFLIALHAFGVRTGTVNLFELGLSLWALHFAFDYIPSALRRQQQ